MEQAELIDGFVKFGMVALVGFVIGLERSMGESENRHATVRDFVIFALIGATSAFSAVQFDNAWLIVGGLFAVVALLALGYWTEQQRTEGADPGLTTEATAVVTFFLGVLIIHGARELAVAIAIVLLIFLSEKSLIERFGARVQRFELQAALKFLVISFIVLPVLPEQSLDNFVTAPIGAVVEIDEAQQEIVFEPTEDAVLVPGAELFVYGTGTGRFGELVIGTVTDGRVSAVFQGDSRAFREITVGKVLRAPFVPDFVSTVLSAVKPFKVWLIVVLVSFIGFIGYVLIKVVGAGAGIGLTGLIGGLASSTVTTLSFAGRSKEYPDLNRLFAVAVILASSIMFPRVLFQIGVFNRQLMQNIALPMLITGGVGLAAAALLYYLSTKKTGAERTEEISFSNPFSLKSAVSFGLIFTTILIATRVATAYLGDEWLPLIAIVSGLTDADAIAFSVSDLQRAGLISLDWASFNLVLGSLANTYMKLFLVYSLGDRGLFRHCLISFFIMGAAGVATMLIFYDLGEVFA